MRVHFFGTSRTVSHGPFENTSDQMAWVKRCPSPMSGDSGASNIRPIFEAEDFGDALTPEVREQEERLREKLGT